MAANSITVTALKIIKAAMREIGALAAGEEPSNDDESDVLEKLQRIIDQWNADDLMTYNVNFQEFDIPTSTQPITIGPGAMWDVNQRPVEIITASLILVNSSPSQVEMPINVRDQQWWAAQRVKNLTSTLPTDLYYSPDWANGQVYLWPIPTDANKIRLQIRLVIAELKTYADLVSMPPGYWDGMVYTLAEALGPMFERPITADLLRLKSKAIRVIESNNVASPRGNTADAGMPGAGRFGDFNYYTALPPDA